MDADRLRDLNEQLLAVPAGFTINVKLAKQLERRHATIVEGGIDWGQGEALAYASLLEDGIPIRLSGQDTERGTFAHRHLMFHDPYTGETFAPIQHLPGAGASFEVYNSPLSEYAALGFEYGYSVAAPDALVLWEAQFGDFVNGAQIVIDQFLVAGRSKWGQTSRLTLLLPHGYEGNGPEHSSGRLERFLQQGAQDNIRIANCTTAAQFFHLLRRQALDATARPLVVMTPKGLLRLKHAASTLARSRDRRVSSRDPRPRRGSRRPAPRPLQRQGLLRHRRPRRARRRHHVAVARLEQLYPFPVEAVAELIAGLPHLEEIVWAQEEPQNMGAWRSIRHRLDDAARSSSAVAGVTYVGRSWRARPSEGYPTAHQREQDRIVRVALGVPVRPDQAQRYVASHEEFRRFRAWRAASRPRHAGHVCVRRRAAGGAGPAAACATGCRRSKPQRPGRRDQIGASASSSHMQVRPPDRAGCLQQRFVG